MNHRPFEDWLLEDQQLTIEQERELRAHLQTCTSCAAIAESNLALHSTRMVSPKAGFVSRFETRLIEHRKAARRRQIVGIIILAMAGVALLYWFVSPAINELINSPAQWFMAVVGYFLFILTSLQALSDISHVFLRLVSDFISPLALLVILFLVSGLGLLEGFTLWQFFRKPQGANL